MELTTEDESGEKATHSVVSLRVGGTEQVPHTLSPDRDTGLPIPSLRLIVSLLLSDGSQQYTELAAVWSSL